ncbi:MAG: FUSC family protein [Thermoleophilia bacterium]
MIDRAALHVGLRAGVALTAGFAVGRYVLDEPQFAVFAAFTSLALVAYADFGGPMRRRLAALVVATVVALGLVAAGTAVSTSASGAPLLVGAVTLVVAYSAVLGGYFVAGANAIVLAVVLAAGIPAPDDALGWRLGGTALGGALAIAVTLTMWPRRRDPDPTSELARAAAALSRCLPGGEGGPRALDAAADEVRALRADLAGPGGPRPAEPTARDRAVLRLVFDMDRLLVRIGTLLRRPGPPAPDAGPLLRRARADLSGAPAGPEPPALLDAAWAGVAAHPPSNPPALARAVEDVAIAGEIAQAARRAGMDAAVAAGGPPPPADPPPLAVARRRLRNNLTLRSVHLRNALRLAVALAVAMAIVQAFELSHGFWVVLATLTVVHSAASTTGITAGQVLLGTAVGFCLGMIIVLGAEQDAHLYVVLLGLVVPAAIYAARAEGLVAGQAGFTVVCVVLFGLLAPETWTLAAVRVEDVVIGAAVGVGVGMLAWPRGAGGSLPAAVAEALARAAEEVRAAGRAALGGEAAGADRAALREATLVAVQRAEDDLAVALAERHPRAASRGTWPALLGDIGSLRYSLDWLDGIPRPRPSGAGSRALAASLSDRLEAVTDRYREVAAALEAGRPAPAAPPVPADDPGVAAAVASAGDADPRGLVDLLAVRSWVREVESRLVHMTDRLGAVLPGP